MNLAGIIRKSIAAATLATATYLSYQYITVDEPRCGTALLVVDMQEIFWKDIPEAERRTEIINHIGAVDCCRSNNIPVYFITFCSSPIMPQLADRLESVTILAKGTVDAFEGTDLAERLRKKRVRTVAVSGVYASACVLATIEGAARAGFKTAVSLDMVSNPSFFETDTEFTCRAKNKGCRVYESHISLLEHLCRERRDNF